MAHSYEERDEDIEIGDTLMSADDDGEDEGEGVPPVGPVDEEEYE